MFLIRDEAELRACFRDVDQPEIFLSPDVQFPIRVVDYLRWVEPAGVRAYAVFKDPSYKGPLGIVFRRDQSLGPSVAAMCEWCHAVRSGNEIGMLTVTTSKRKRVGLSLCRDLSCAQKIRAQPGPNDLSAHGDEPARVRAVVTKMAEFSRRELI